MGSTGRVLEVFIKTSGVVWGIKEGQGGKGGWGELALNRNPWGVGEGVRLTIILTDSSVDIF